MNTFSIRKSIKQGWNIFTANKKVLIASTFVILVAQAISRQINQLQKSDISIVVIMIAVAVAAAILDIGWLKLLLKLIDGEVATERELIAHSRLFWRYAYANIVLIVVTVLSVLPVFLAYFLLSYPNPVSYDGFVIVAGVALILAISLYITLTYGLVPVIIIDSHLKLKESFMKSKEICRGHRLKILTLYFALLLVNILGLLALVVGLLVSIPVSALAYLIAYRKLSQGHI